MDDPEPASLPPEFRGTFAEAEKLLRAPMKELAGKLNRSEATLEELQTNHNTLLQTHAATLTTLATITTERDHLLTLSLLPPPPPASLVTPSQPNPTPSQPKQSLIHHLQSQLSSLQTAHSTLAEKHKALVLKSQRDRGEWSVAGKKMELKIRRLREEVKVLKGDGEGEEGQEGGKGKGKGKRKSSQPQPHSPSTLTHILLNSPHSHKRPRLSVYRDPQPSSPGILDFPPETLYIMSPPSLPLVLPPAGDSLPLTSSAKANTPTKPTSTRSPRSRKSPRSARQASQRSQTRGVGLFDRFLPQGGEDVFGFGERIVRPAAGSAPLQKEGEGADVEMDGGGGDFIPETIFPNPNGLQPEQPDIQMSPPHLPLILPQPIEPISPTHPPAGGLSGSQTQPESEEDLPAPRAAVRMATPPSAQKQKHQSPRRRVGGWRNGYEGDGEGSEREGGREEEGEGEGVLVQETMMPGFGREGESQKMKRGGPSRISGNILSPSRNTRNPAPRTTKTFKQPPPPGSGFSTPTSLIKPGGGPSKSRVSNLQGEYGSTPRGTLRSEPREGKWMGKGELSKGSSRSGGGSSRKPGAGRSRMGRRDSFEDEGSDAIIRRTAAARKVEASIVTPTRGDGGSTTEAATAGEEDGMTVLRVKKNQFTPEDEITAGLSPRARRRKLKEIERMTAEERAGLYAGRKGGGRYGQTGPSSNAIAGPIPRLNPDRNNGMDYQYAETVRSKEGRKHMHAVDCECCQGYYQATKHLPRPGGDMAFKESSTDQDADDEDRQNVQMQRHKNEVSRHREQYIPQKDAPGYWNKDFPTTQQVREQNAEADKRKAEKLKRQHEEAAKPNGMYYYNPNI